MRIDLFRFDEEGTLYTVTSGTKPITYNSEVYVPVAVGRTDIIATQQLSKADIDVSFSLNNITAKRWMTTIIDKSINLIIYTQTDDAGTITSWQGRMSSATTDGKSAVFSFEPIFTALRIPGLRKRYQRTCAYSLYGRGCNVLATSFETNGTVATLNGTTVEVAAAAGQASGYYAGGYIQDATGAKRYITNHSGAFLTLSRELFGLAVGGPVKIYAGCDRSTDVCQARFNNIANFGGFPFIPLKNPFAGTALV
jgi:uncharacterized phage protein (TIGR02218 family)